jgi:hypothetical protein
MNEFRTHGDSSAINDDEPLPPRPAPVDPGAASFNEQDQPIYGEGYERTGRSVKRSHRGEGRNYVD